MEDRSERTEAPHVEALLGHTAWARRLAAGIVTDAGTAEDAVQDAWVAALLHPPRHGRNLRSWLSFLVRNAVRQGARAEARRRRRERAVARTEHLPAAADAIERAEMHRRLVEAVLDLPDPCRSVVVLTYFDDLAPRDVGRRLGMPSSTVRSHIRRGLHSLRVKLEREGEERGGGMLAGLAALAWNRGGGLVSIPSATAGGGGILMTLKTKLVIAAAVLALLGGWTWKSLESGTAPRLSETSAADAELSVADSRFAPRPDPAASPEELRVPGAASPQAPEEPDPGTLLVTVRWERDGTPAAGVGVQLRRRGDLHGLETIEGETGGAGSLRFERLRPGGAWITADRSESAEIVILPGETTEVALEIPTGTEIRGRVVDLEKEPVAGAEIWLSWGDDQSSGRIAARANETGRFVLRDVQEQQTLGARASGHAPSSLRVVDRAAGEEMDVELILPGPGGVVEGRVLDPEGSPVAGARIEVRETYPHPLRYEGTFWAAFPAAAGRGISDVAGQFRITDAAAGTCELTVRAKGFACSRTMLEIPAGGAAREDVRLSRGAVLSGTVVDTRGTAVSGIPLWIARSAEPSRKTIGGAPREYIGSSDASGRFRIEALTPGPTNLVIEKDDLGCASTTVDFAEGIETTWEAVLSRGLEISGRVVDAQGQGLPQWFVEARFGKKRGIRDDELQWLNWRATCHSAADGRFVLLNCPPDVPLRVGVSSPERLGQELAGIDDVKAGAEDLEILVGADARPSAFLLGRVLDAGDRPVGDAEVRAHRTLGGSVSLGVRTDAVTGKFRLGPLPAGEYRVFVRADGRSLFETPPHELAENQELDLGELRFPEAGTVLVRLQFADGAPAGDVALSIYGESKTPVALLTITDRIARSAPLPTGSYRLVVSENHRTTQEVRFDVSTDHETQLALVLSVAPH